MTTHEHPREELASYVLGALDPGDRARLDTHLARCAQCRDELASYAGMPALMSRLSIDEALDDSLLPPPDVFPRLLDAVERDRRADRTHLRRWRLAAVGLAATTALSAVLLVSPNQVQDEPTQQLVAAAGSPARGTATLSPRAWGSSVELTVAGLPPADFYVAWTEDPAGTRIAVASWGPTDAGRAVVTGATALDPDAIRRLTVDTDDGRRLLTLLP